MLGIVGRRAFNRRRHQFLAAVEGKTAIEIRVKLTLARTEAH